MKLRHLTVVGVLVAGMLAISMPLTASGAPFLQTPGSTKPVDVVTVLALSGSTGAASRRTYRLRWPARPGQRATYTLTLNSVRPRAISLRVYGINAPRGFGFDFLVACEHRGPAALNWNWKQRGSAVRITVKMFTGKCDRPGPQVAGTFAALNFTLTP